MGFWGTFLSDDPMAMTPNTDMDDKINPQCKQISTIKWHQVTKSESKTHLYEAKSSCLMSFCHKLINQTLGLESKVPHPLVDQDRVVYQLCWAIHHVMIWKWQLPKNSWFIIIFPDSSDHADAPTPCVDTPKVPHSCLSFCIPIHQCWFPQQTNHQDTIWYHHMSPIQ